MIHVRGGVLVQLAMQSTSAGASPMHRTEPRPALIAMMIGIIRYSSEIVNFDDVRTQALTARPELPKVLEIPRYAISALGGADVGRRWVVEGPTVTLGTAPSNVVVLADETVSRFHCEVSLRNGRHVLRDLGSTNGTLVDGVEILEAFLPDKTRVTLGELVLDVSTVTRHEPLEPALGTRFGEIVGRSEIMRRTFAFLSRIAPTTLGVLLLGETGTGKELAARSIHEASPRANGAFVVVDCAAIQRTLVESQLFGHERGAFTGADRQHHGAFEQSHGGTIFFDEIGELPLDLQPRLLRALERREVTRLGGSRPVEVDVRVIAATHRDLAAMVADGTFREDLYYRLAETVVALPPLRERLADVQPIAEAILASLSPTARLMPDALEVLARHPWPGNVRELRNVLRRASAFAQNGVIDASTLAAAPVPTPMRTAEPRDAGGIDVHDELALKDARERWLAELEPRYLRAVMSRFGNDLDLAAEHVGIHRKSVQRLLREHDLSRE